MDRRRENRLDCRLECQLELAVQRFHGRVLNVSHRGMFVRTVERVPEARSVLITVGELAIPSGALPTLQAVVTRRSWAPEPLPALATGGLGLSIRGVPDAWLELLADLASRRRPGGSHAMPPLRLVAPTRCAQCGREHVTLWSGACGWCSATRPRENGALRRRW